MQIWENKNKNIMQELVCLAAKGARSTLRRQGMRKIYTIRMQIMLIQMHR